MGRDPQLFPINKSRQRQDGRGLGSQASRIVAGIRFPVMASRRARPARVARSNLEWAPAESPAVQAGVQVPASRRAKSPPVLPHARRPPETPGAQRLEKSAAGTQRQSCHCTITLSLLDDGEGRDVPQRVDHPRRDELLARIRH
jgi:hypothetical protein